MANKFTISSVFQAVDHMTGPLQKMNAKVEQLGQSAEKAGKTMKDKFGALGGIAKSAALGLGAAAAAAGAAVVGLSLKAQKAADSVVDTAGALGVSTRALQEYRYVAALSGMETDDMDKALQKLTIGLGKGGKELDTVLAMLGLTAEQLKSAGPDQVLELIAEGMKNVTDPTAKAAITTQLFGKSSVRMVNALSGGADAIARLRQEAEDVGYVMDETALAAGTRLGDAMDRLQLVADGAANRLGIAFAPMIERTVTAFTKLLAGSKGMEKAFTALGDTLGGVFDAIAPVLQSTFEILTPVFRILARVMKGISPILKLVGNLLAKMMPFVAAVAELIADILGPALEALAPILEPVFDVLGLIFKILTPIIQALSWLAKSLMGLFSGLPGPVKAVLGIMFPFIGIPILISKAWGSIKAFMGGIWDGIKTAAGPVLDKIGELATTVPQALMAAWEAVGQFFVGLWNGITAAFQSAADFIMGLIQPIIDLIGTIQGGLAALGLASAPTPAGAGAGGGSVPIGSNTTTINRNTNSTLDVNFNNTPPGTSFKSSGAQAPGVTLATGKADLR